MTMYGYARVSTSEQDLALQTETLTQYGFHRSEKSVGTSTDNRHELNTLLDFVREHELVVTRIDRLARSVFDFVRSLAEKGVALKATEQPIDTSTAAGKCFLDMLSVFAEFETNLRRERQMEGVAKAKAAGKYKGRPASINAVRLREMKANGASVKEICGELGISRASVYRLLEASS